MLGTTRGDPIFPTFFRQVKSGGWCGHHKLAHHPRTSTSDVTPWRLYHGDLGRWLGLGMTCGEGVDGWTGVMKCPPKTNTVDGRNLAPPGMSKTLSIMGFQLPTNWCRISSINSRTMENQAWMSRCISYFQDGDFSAIAMLVNATHFGFPKNVNSSPLKSSPPKTERIVFQTSFFRSGFFKLPGSIRSTVLTVAGYHFLLLPLVGWGIYEKKYHVTYLKAGFWDFKSLQPTINFLSFY